MAQGQHVDCARESPAIVWWESRSLFATLWSSAWGQLGLGSEKRTKKPRAGSGTKREQEISDESVSSSFTARKFCSSKWENKLIFKVANKTPFMLRARRVRLVGDDECFPVPSACSFLPLSLSFFRTTTTTAVNSWYSISKHQHGGSGDGATVPHQTSSSSSVRRGQGECDEARKPSRNRKYVNEPCKIVHFCCTRTAAAARQFFRNEGGRVLWSEDLGEKMYRLNHVRLGSIKW